MLPGVSRYRRALSLFEFHLCEPHCLRRPPIGAHGGAIETHTFYSMDGENSHSIFLCMDWQWLLQVNMNVKAMCKKNNHNTPPTHTLSVSKPVKCFLYTWPYRDTTHPNHLLHRVDDMRPLLDAYSTVVSLTKCWHSVLCTDSSMWQQEQGDACMTCTTVSVMVKGRKKNLVNNHTCVSLHPCVYVWLHTEHKYANALYLYTLTRVHFDVYYYLCGLKTWDTTFCLQRHRSYACWWGMVVFVFVGQPGLTFFFSHSCVQWKKKLLRIFGP